MLKNKYKLRVKLKRHIVTNSVREYVFYVFFRFEKNMTFMFFGNDVSKSRKKSLTKVYFLIRQTEFTYFTQ